MKKKIATIGSITMDLFVKPEKSQVFTQTTEHKKSEFLALPHGGKICADTIKMHLGGGASNTATSFKRQNYSVDIFGGIGDDDQADTILKKISAENISINNIEKFSNTKSGFSLILNAFDGERTVIYTSQANKKYREISIEDLEAGEYEALHLCHIATSHPEKIFTTLESFFIKHPEKIFSWNPGKESIEKGIQGNKKILEHTNFLYLNAEEAEEFTGICAKKSMTYGEERRKIFFRTDSDSHHLPEYATCFASLGKKILESGVQCSIITDGMRGAQIFTPDVSLFVPTQKNSKRVDTLGAGDAFASTFTGMIVQGKTLQESAKYASIQASNVVAHQGAQDGLLSLENLLQKFSLHHTQEDEL